MPKYLAVLGFLVFPTCCAIHGQEPAGKVPPRRYMIQFMVAERDLKNGDFDRLSRPLLIAGEDGTAVLNADNSPGLMGGNLTMGWVYPRLGFRVQVTPRIAPGGMMDLHVIAKVKATVPQQVSVGDSFEGHLTAEDGQTVVTRGIKVTERTIDERKIPWLGDLPAIGGMFRSRVHGVSQSEVLVFLTPYIIHSGEDEERVSKEAWKTTDRFLHQHYPHWRHYD